MSKGLAIAAIREMRLATDEGNMQLASYWALIFLAEDRAGETGDFLRERRLEYQNSQSESSTR